MAPKMTSQGRREKENLLIAHCVSSSKRVGKTGVEASIMVNGELLLCSSLGYDIQAFNLLSWTLKKQAYSPLGTCFISIVDNSHLFTEVWIMEPETREEVERIEEQLDLEMAEAALKKNVFVDWKAFEVELRQ